MSNLPLSFAVLLGLLVLHLSSTLLAQGPPPLAITHAVIIDGNGQTPIEDGTLVIRGGKIETVGLSSTLRVPADAKVIDARGAAVMPGLADMHVHLTGGWDGVSSDLLGYRRYLNALLYAGVTTVLDTGNVQDYILQMRQEVAAGRLPGPRIYCAGALIDGSDPAWPPISFAVSSVAQIPGIVHRQKRDGVDLIKAYQGLSIPMVTMLASEAKKSGLSVIIDQWSRNGSIDLIRTGIAAFAHLPTSPMSDEAVSLMKERDVHAITTLAVYETGSRRRLTDQRFLESPLVKDTMPPWFLQEIRAEASRTLNAEESATAKASIGRLGAAQKNARKLFDAGILLVGGTDAPYPGDFYGEGIHRELELLVDAGLTPLEAITIATRNAASLMNASSEWGTVVPGRVANVLVINGRPDKNISDTRNIQMVIQAGKIIEREKLKFDAPKDPGFRAIGSMSATN